MAKYFKTMLGKISVDGLHSGQSSGDNKTNVPQKPWKMENISERFVTNT
jgi:hypothetical protein